MTKYLKFLFTAYRAYQGDPAAAAEVIRTVIAKAEEVKSKVQGS